MWACLKGVEVVVQHKNMEFFTMDHLATGGRTAPAAAIGSDVSRASETAEWFLEQQPRSAFLFPDNYFGPDLTAFLRIPGGKIIHLILQAKRRPDEHFNPAPHQEAIAALDPKNFYTKKVCVPTIVHL